MIMKRYRQFDRLIEFSQPKTIVEIGTNKGNAAEAICREALRYNKAVHYIGYDLFEDATRDTNRSEVNAKPPCTEAEVRDRLSKIEGLTFELVRGNTKDTLHGTDVVADLVFIDGGHSVETIRGDYEAVKGSPLIVFDDYYSWGAADTTKVGCNSIVAGLPHELLPREDRINGVGIKFAVVGYSTTWAAAFKRIREHDNVKSVAIWRPELRKRCDLVAAIDCLEKSLEPDEILESIRSICKRMFFVIKADAIRSLDWWRTEIEKKFEVQEWFGGLEDLNGPTTEVCGTARPLFLQGERPARGVVKEDERFEHVKANIVKTAKRLAHIQEPHGNLAIIVCYGPSLNDNWVDLMSQVKFHGGDVFSVSGSHDFLIRRDLIPKYHIEVDPREHKARNMTRPTQGVQYLIASCCHPTLVDKLVPYDLTLWHMANSADSFRTVDELEPDQFMVHGGGNAGLRAIAVAYVMGYRNFVIYGMDCSFKGDQQWAGPHTGKRKDVIEVVCEGEKFLTSGINVTYARQFLSMLDQAPGANFHLVGHGLLQALVKATNKQVEKERAANLGGDAASEQTAA